MRSALLTLTCGSDASADLLRHLVPLGVTSCLVLAVDQVVSDGDVEAGGGTNFPQLDITVMPKKGRALLWPSVLDSNPMKKDGRMMHQALEVEEGIKYAANGWIHMHDYVTAQAKGCS